MSEPLVVAGRVEPAGDLLAYPEGRLAELADLRAPAAVCLVVRGGGEGLDACLAALEALEGRPPVVVVDDGSRDWSFVLAARFAARCDRAVALRRVGPPDFARALRAAAPLTGAERVLVCGAGDVLAPDAVAAAGGCPGRGALRGVRGRGRLRRRAAGSTSGRWRRGRWDSTSRRS